MISKAQRRNAQRIVTLADTFGHLYFNDAGQTPEKVLNLSIPCARLVVAGIVTGVADTNDGINDSAVADVEDKCRAAVDFATEQHGPGWWTGPAASLLGRPSEYEARRPGGPGVELSGEPRPEGSGVVAHRLDEAGFAEHELGLGEIDGAGV